MRSCHSNWNKFFTPNKQEVKITLYLIKFLRGEECLKIHCVFLIYSKISFGIINMIYNTFKSTYLKSSPIPRKGERDLCIKHSFDCQCTFLNHSGLCNIEPGTCILAFLQDFYINLSKPHHLSLLSLWGQGDMDGKSVYSFLDLAGYREKKKWRVGTSSHVVALQ